jgi:tight adherence protein C
MDTISFMLANMFRDNASVLMALLVFLATGTAAFSLMAFVRVRGAVKRRTVRLMGDAEQAAKSSRSLRYSSLKRWLNCSNTPPSITRGPMTAT